jgi:4-hydroxybenzoate polyprenyltransferase
VWRWGFGWLGAGTVLLVLLGGTTGAFAALLLFSIVFYDAVHKVLSLAPMLMGACRLFLYLTAASVGVEGVGGLAIWSAVALGFYITGLGYLARHEKSKTALPRWPVLLIATPVALALVANSGEYRLRALILAFLVSLWILRSLQPAMLIRDLNVARSVERLLAGIVLVDWLALAGGASLLVGLAFLCLFVLALVLQRSVPAT